MSDAAFFAAACVGAARSETDRFHTLAACVTKVSPPLRGTVICPVLADLLVFAVAVLSENGDVRRILCPQRQKFYY
jgi:hypothetical protein